ncbi:MAG TPA: bifunctional alpha,alpha-trehalose-phosphate synthase (UDP-forming)/trehalose-phosphatase, partial [Pyrinomonadaceae bacterium]|nr:bifunctional alpha,alpha-trehalose-phosphate synthase (UDP-forming)/trehalose-phosphatase [Pyrinomonadaceae bacterium]
FYEGIANEALWPLFHHFPSLLRFEAEHWKAYVRANEIFRDEILKHLRPDDLVWIHDYHFLLLPQMLREVTPDISIGFFLHVPFPSSSVFRIIPKREELLQGMLGADYLGFHTHRYLQHFRTSILRLMGVTSAMDHVEIGKRIVRLDALPIGIAPRQFNDLLTKSAGTRKQISELKQRFGYCKILLGVDRMDYTKGIPERLRAYRKFLQDYPEWHGKVVLIQVAVPSRERVPRYARLRREVDELIGEINGDWSTADWSPITYLRRNLPQAELAALYACADVALVTPLRDGLNLVAKEYVACKSSGDGVLVLSEFAGAAAEMGEALLVNPYDEEDLSATIARALSIGETEKRERMMALYRRVNKNNVFAWGDRFIKNLTTAVQTRSERPHNEPLPLEKKQLLDSFDQAQSRLLMLDYDGTLAPFATLPQNAVPSSNVLEIIERLVQDENSTVALISGRSRKDLERWFVGIPNLWIAAEHGAVFWSPVSGTWEQPHHAAFNEWKKCVYPILEHFVDRTPGSFIEEKEFSLVWHYRMADPEFGDWLANDLVANLDHMLAESPVKAVKGQKTVEVKSLWANKGQVYSRLQISGAVPDFIMAAGDDVTDEDLFARLPETAWTIHVGRNQSRARYYLSSPDEMVALLAQLLDARDTVCIRDSDFPTDKNLSLPERQLVIDAEPPVAHSVLVRIDQ